MDNALSYLAGFIPARVSGAFSISGAVPTLLTPLTATLLHAGIAHLVLNLITLVFTGRPVEAARGAGFLLGLYVVGAYAAAAAQFFAGPAGTTPMVGASGAISAVLAAYALMFGQLRTRGGRPISPFMRVLWLAAGWIGLQLLVGFAFQAEGVMIATAAHIGGFFAGLVLTTVLRPRR